jgi:hypothetical protein
MSALKKFTSKLSKKSSEGYDDDLYEDDFEDFDYGDFEIDNDVIIG